MNFDLQSDTLMRYCAVLVLLLALLSVWQSQQLRQLRQECDGLRAQAEQARRDALIAQRDTRFPEGTALCFGYEHRPGQKPVFFAPGVYPEARKVGKE